MSGKAKIRCAIYTRKSSEEGLEQEFNSLDAQYEACAAYVASQKHEGWTMLRDRYDDGGISGGTLERPAVQRLLADIDAGRVDRVIVYKVDRLTRSLADFAKLVERFDEAGASFVSVTQSFNTATSMGRLTLNVLLSFAQFEREVTAERIRDKIAASKKKGMWMGGVAPLGYDAKDRTLVVNDAEAETVRTIFDLYEEHRGAGSVARIAEERGLRTKSRSAAEGAPRGGRQFSRGHIHFVLTNPVYAGRIRHKEIFYDGAHDPIIDPERWDRVQAMLAEAAARPRGRGAGSARAPLTGKLFDETGDRLTPSHANTKGRRYRYYVSHRLIARADGAGAAGAAGWRLPAEALERAVAEAMAAHLESPGVVAGILSAAAAPDFEQVAAGLNSIAAALRSDDGRPQIGELVQSATLAPGSLAVEVSAAALAKSLDRSPDALSSPLLSFTAPFALRRRGVEARIVVGGGAAEVDEALLRNLAKAIAWLDELKAGGSMRDLLARERVSRQRFNQVMKLAFLAPGLVAAIVRGEQPDGLTADSLMRARRLDLWLDQRVWAARLTA